MFYYAVQYAYGKYTLNKRGNQADQVHRFSTPQERDDWVAEGGVDEYVGGYREALASKDRRLVRAKQLREIQGSQWPVSILNW